MNTIPTAQPTVTFNVPMVVWNKAALPAGVPTATGAPRKGARVLPFGELYGPALKKAQGSVTERKKGRGFYMEVTAPRELAETMRHALAEYFKGRKSTQGDEYQVRTSAGEIADRIAQALGLGVTVRAETAAAKPQAPQNKARKPRVDMDSVVPGPDAVELCTLSVGTVFFTKEGYMHGPTVERGPIPKGPYPLKFVQTGWKRGVVVFVGMGSVSVRYESRETRTFVPTTGENAGQPVTIQAGGETVTIARSTVVYPGVEPGTPGAQPLFFDTEET